jgi:uncharacterized protein (DUF2147 family)
MKKIQILVLLMLSTSLATFAQNKDAILGRWLNSKGEGQIEIYKRGDKFFGKMAWLKEPNLNGKPKLDVNNPEEKLKSKPILNLEILKDFVYDDGKWIDGTIYDPRSGKTYSCTISLKGNKLNVRGYVGISIIGKTEIFTKVD